MKIRRLFVDATLHEGQSLSLPGDAAHYLGRVLRLKVGDVVHVFNDGVAQHEAHIAELTRNAVTLAVAGRLPLLPEPPIRLVLWQGLSRNEKMDLTIQKAVELGVAAIRPVLTERSVIRRDAAREARRLAHWRAVVVHAAQQCGRCHLPEIAPTCGLNEALATLDGNALALCADPQATRSLADAVAGVKATTVHALVGPEGGLTGAEIERAQAAGFAGVTAGPRVLRTETAAIALLATLQFALGDWR